MRFPIFLSISVTSPICLFSFSSVSLLPFNYIPSPVYFFRATTHYQHLQIAISDGFHFPLSGSSACLLYVCNNEKKITAVNNRSLTVADQTGVPILAHELLFGDNGWFGLRNYNTYTSFKLHISSARKCNCYMSIVYNPYSLHYITMDAW